MVVATSPQAFARRASRRPGTPIEQTRDPRIVQSFKDERYKTCLLIDSITSVAYSFNHMSI